MKGGWREEARAKKSRFIRAEETHQNWGQSKARKWSLTPLEEGTGGIEAGVGAGAGFGRLGVGRAHLEGAAAAHLDPAEAPTVREAPAGLQDVVFSFAAPRRAAESRTRKIPRRVGVDLLERGAGARIRPRRSRVPRRAEPLLDEVLRR